MSRFVRGAWWFAWLSAAIALPAAEHALVLQTDFGTKDGAVGAMKGVAATVDRTLLVHDLSHENTPFDVWEAAYRLKQAAPYWPAGTVFVSVVDPGVGTARKSVVVATESGHYFVGPDNGTWTLVAEELGIRGVREIDETRERRAGSERSYTFHGRDVYVHVGARLASGQAKFDEIGPELPARVISLPYERARLENGAIIGTIPFLDFQFGNVWTNVNEALFAKLEPKFGEQFRVVILRDQRQVYAAAMPYARTFGDVPDGAPLLYLNSLMNVAFALNQASFAERFGVGCGNAWSVRIERIAP